MGIRTSKGDKGLTYMLSGERCSKDSEEMRAIGELDELNSYLGLIKAKVKGRRDKEVLETLQRGVCIAASEISISAEDKKKHGFLFKRSLADVAQRILFDLEGKVRIGRHFYMPGENELAAFFDVSRAVARRAERSMVGLFTKSKYGNEHILSFLNCVSDILFVMARAAGQGKSGAKRKRKPRKQHRA